MHYAGNKQIHATHSLTPRQETDVLRALMLRVSMLGAVGPAYENHNGP